jgi:hypothetical protein
MHAVPPPFEKTRGPGPPDQGWHAAIAEEEFVSDVEKNVPSPPSTS